MRGGRRKGLTFRNSLFRRGLCGGERAILKPATILSQQVWQTTLLDILENRPSRFQKPGRSGCQENKNVQKCAGKPCLASCLFGLGIAFFEQQCEHAVAVVTLNDNLAVFCRPSNSAFGFQEFAQILEGVVTADKPLDQGDFFTPPVLAVQVDAKFLLRRGKVIDALFGFLELKIRVCRKNDAVFAWFVFFAHAKRLRSNFSALHGFGNGKVHCPVR
ncbi:MAG: hypothetical protein KIPDCIKN_03136 [Haliscomenobacter sp.]|jgi:hypothetical protein|nr:hypothetical protein [Haliscomenobacter sp.]